MTIDWNAPIEDLYGRPMYKCVGMPGRWLSYGNGGRIFQYSETGEPLGTGPPIRNVRPKPETPAQTYDPALVERMVGLVRRISRGPDWRIGQGTYNEACTIAALLPEPVDADLVEAADMVHAWLTDSDADITKSFAAAIRRGRELEREGK